MPTAGSNSAGGSTDFVRHLGQETTSRLAAPQSPDQDDRIIHFHDEGIRLTGDMQIGRAPLIADLDVQVSG